MPTSAKNLKGMLPAIANHVCSSCPCVPQQVRSELEKYGGKLEEEQEAGLKRGSVLQLCENAFGRLQAHDTRSTSQEAVDTAVTRLPKNATSVVLDEDKSTASDYCFYSLSQMMPCILDEKRQGSRGSAFPIGTPGLACRHCASSTNPRERRRHGQQLRSHFEPHPFVPSRSQVCEDGTPPEEGGQQECQQ